MAGNDSMTVKKAFDAWFRLADKVAQEYGIPFTEIDKLASFLQKTAFEIATEKKYS